MLYQLGRFTLPAAGQRTTQENWDRAFLSDEEFLAKYGHSK
jgi:hypothetical protein